MNRIDPQRKSMIVNFIKEHYVNHTLSEMGRMLNITPSSVRFHGIEAGVKFKYRRPSKEKVVFTEGKYFNESHRENWLI